MSFDLVSWDAVTIIFVGMVVWLHALLLVLGTSEGASPSNNRDYREAIKRGVLNKTIKSGAY